MSQKITGRLRKKLKLTLAALVALSFAVSATPQAAFAAADVEPTPPAWTMNLSEEEAAALNPTAEQWQELQAYDAALRNQIYRELDNSRGTISVAGLEAKTVGQIMVTLEVNSGSAAIGVGHAGIIANDTNYVVESWAKAFSPIKKDGVQLYNYSHWKQDYAGRAWRIRTNGPAAASYAKAGSWAEAQINKPYNFNFVNKWDTSRFYCSQLVWRAWKEQGFDIAKGAAKLTTFISPAQLLKGNTIVLENI